MRRPWQLVTALLFLTGMARAETPPDLAGYDALIKPADRRHWAFQPVRTPPLPAVRDTAWPRNPIDRFVLARLEAQGWQPAAPAQPRALLRRLYLDLLGLPPTPAEQEAFLRDPTPAALDRVVDDLLARPAYGERWARHWLDLVRYAETNGYERDATKPHAWRYRDYVIRAFNADKPFDRFVQEQLAGDELPDAGAETLIATGYYRLGPWDDEPADPREDRFDQLDDLVHTTTQVFLGLTLACARCHNHKFEPLTMHDYYRMVAVFHPLERPRKGRTELDLPVGTKDEVRRQEAWDRHCREAVGYRVSALGYPPTALGQLLFLAESRRPRADRRPPGPALPRGYFLHEPTPVPPRTHLLHRGQASRPGPEVQPGLPAVLVAAQPAFPPSGGGTSQRRLTLARWLTDPDNPLVARVFVNRVWQSHFGEGLVRTPSDIGVMGEPPTHPELLDWLAAWFVREGWSVKKLHRLILASNTWRMSRQGHPAYADQDPENRLLWHLPYRRLEVEALRDAMLAVSGRLNPTMYGPSMYPPIPKEALDGHSDPTTIWKPSEETEASRRTVYAFVKRSMLVPLLEVLDFCDTARTTARRNVTNIAPQALTLFNGDFVNRQARHLAGRLLREAGQDPDRQIERAYLLALCRPPTPAERAALRGFLDREAEELRRDASAGGRTLDPETARQRALEQMCRVVFNLNEFAYLE
jgi:hypothetical protein